jgi:hypothetical protein
LTRGGFQVEDLASPKFFELAEESLGESRA